MLKELTQEKIYFRLASLILVVLFVSVACTTESLNQLFLTFCVTVLRGLFGATLGIIAVFTLNAEFPKQLQIIKHLVRVAIFINLALAFVIFIGDFTLDTVLTLFVGLYFLGFCYSWGKNKVKEGSYANLQKYKKTVLYPAIIYFFVLSPIANIVYALFLSG